MKYRLNSNTNDDQYWNINDDQSQVSGGGDTTLLDAGSLAVDAGSRSSLVAGAGSNAGTFAGSNSAELNAGTFDVLTGAGTTGLKINLQFVLADNPTQAFENAIIQAANILDATIKNDITVNLTIGYGEVDGHILTNGSAAAGPSGGAAESYSTIRAKLMALGAAGSGSLPSGSVNGHTTVDVWDAQLKALGFLSANASEVDGAAGFAKDIQSNLLVGVALHELTHAMGRVPDNPSRTDILELYRFTRATACSLTPSLGMTPPRSR